MKQDQVKEHLSKLNVQKSMQPDACWGSWLM